MNLVEPQQGLHDAAQLIERRHDQPARQGSQRQRDGGADGFDRDDASEGRLPDHISVGLLPVHKQNKSGVRAFQFDVVQSIGKVFRGRARIDEFRFSHVQSPALNGAPYTTPQPPVGATLPGGESFLNLSAEIRTERDNPTREYSRHHPGCVSSNSNEDTKRKREKIVEEIGDNPRFALTVSVQNAVVTGVHGFVSVDGAARC